MNTLEDALDINCVSRTFDERTRWFCLHVIVSGDIERTTDRLNVKAVPDEGSVSLR